MTRKLLLLFVLLFAVAPLFAQENANDVAHGSEKAAHEVAHPGEAHGEGHEAPKTYFGIPGWILKLANMLVFLGLLGWLIGGPVKNAFAARPRKRASVARKPTSSRPTSSRASRRSRTNCARSASAPRPRASARSAS